MKTRTAAMADLSCALSRAELIYDSFLIDYFEVAPDALRSNLAKRLREGFAYFLLTCEQDFAEFSSWKSRIEQIFEEVESLVSNVEDAELDYSSDVEEVVFAISSAEYEYLNEDKIGETLGAYPRDTALFVASDWNSSKGGLSTFNMNIALAFAQSGWRVVCYVREFNGVELENATAHGISLFMPDASPGMSSDARMASLMPIVLRGLNPTLIFGHDRQTGPIALHLKSQYFQEAKLVQMVHTTPWRIEQHKSDQKSIEEAYVDANSREELQVNLLRFADAVVSVGPKLFRDTETKIRAISGTDSKQIHFKFIPGFTQRNEYPPICDLPRNILFFGRAEDHILKGLDIAYGSFKKLNHEQHKYEFRIVGATQRDLKVLQKNYPEAQLSSYEENVELLREKIRASTVVVMPSREEGFGLVAMEALEGNRPVLVSNKSGFSMFLRDEFPDFAENFIFSLDGESSSYGIDMLAMKISKLFEDWERTLIRLAIIRERLKDKEWRFRSAELLEKLNALSFESRMQKLQAEWCERLNETLEDVSDEFKAYARTII